MRERKGLSGFPKALQNEYLMLAIAALWTAYATVLYGVLRESHSYRPEMLLGGVVVAVVLFLLGWAHPALYLVGAFLVGLLNGIYAHTAHYWHIGDLPVRVETALDSSGGEMSEFLDQFVVHSKFAWVLIAYVLIALALGAWVWYLHHKHGQQTPPHPWRRLGKGLAAAVVVGGLGYWVVASSYPALALGVTSVQVYTRVNPVLKRKENVAAFMAHAKPLHCTAAFDKIVYVQGESANRDYMHAYGYDLPTTPFLDSLKNKVQIRAISPANQTMTSIPILLTPATVENYDVFYTSPSIISDLRRCGYQTFWLSNQLRYSPYTDTVSSIAAEADVVRFVLEVLKPSTTPPDGALLQLFSPDEIVPGKKQAFFFHLMGSHYEWSRRYPPDQALIPHPKNRIEEYVNTIYYTDHILSQLFEIFQARGENVLFIYTSDHGEWMTATAGGHADAHPYQEEYRVPLVFWATHPEVLRPIAEATQGRIVNTETLDLQIRFLLGLEDNPGISYSYKVLSLGPGRVIDYRDLPYLNHRETH